jgi:hypothetical protein
MKSEVFSSEVELRFGLGPPGMHWSWFSWATTNVHLQQKKKIEIFGCGPDDPRIWRGRRGAEVDLFLLSMTYLICFHSGMK